MSKVNEFFDKVLLINLKSRPDRLAKTKTFLDKHNIDYELVEAIDGNTNKEVHEIYDKVSKNSLRDFEKERGAKVVTTGKIGCLMSHLKCYNMIKDNGWGKTLILEDDIIFCRDFDERINILDKIPDNWGMLYLGASDYRNVANKARFMNHGIKGYYYGFGAAGRFAYSIKQSMIDIVLEKYEDKSLWDMPGDVILKRAQSHCYTVFLNPNIIIADVRDSNLRNKRDIEKHSKKMGWDLSLFDYQEKPEDPVKIYETRNPSKRGKINHYHDAIDGWFDFENIYKDAIDNVVRSARFVEVGGYKGKSTVFMAVEILNSKKRIQFDVVDNFQGPTNSDVDPDKLCDEFKHNTSPVSKAITLVRKPSLDAVGKYKDESLDFVFIDAAHDYESVKADINAWWPKIKNGGIMAGHDYTDKWPGVVKAVDEKFPGRNISRCSWIVKK